jgi:GNAT superfamily N-acetyltransferase
MVISIPDLERTAAAGWRAPEEIPLGGWLLRAADGFTGRANSALAIGDPGLPLAAAIGEVRQWYQARGLPAMVAVSFPLGQPPRSGEWAGFTAFEVDPARRRRGLASAIIAALAGLARDRGIAGLYLQAEDGNAAARSLYRQAGFADHHGYHYRMAP